MENSLSLAQGEPQTAEPQPALLAHYRWFTAGFVFSLTGALLALVDFRRGFIFPGDWYTIKTPFFLYSAPQLLLLGIALLGMAASYRSMKRREAHLPRAQLEGTLRGLTFVICAIIVADLFTYRGVAASRAAAAGKLGTDWLAAFGVTGPLQPIALSLSYLVTVWHATLLGVLLAGLALTILPRYFRLMYARTGWIGTILGALYALPQPFCSCCSSVVLPSLVRRGASPNFYLAFLVGAPMLNITTLILAALLLPPPYALARIVAGIVITLFVTYLSARFLDRTDCARVGEGAVAPSQWAGWTERWMNGYTRLFHLEELVRERPTDTPAQFLRAWLAVSVRIGAVMVSLLLFWTIVTAVLTQVLPPAFGNNVPSIILAALAGTLLMVPTWTEIPLALQMIQGGLNGPAAALLVVLPPVSLPALLLLAGATGRLRIVALLGALIAALGVIVGIAYM